MNKSAVLKFLKQYFHITAGVLMVDFAFYFFMDPTGIQNGGMMGLAIILKPFYSLIGDWFTTSIFMYIADIVTLILGLIFLGKDFFIKTIYATLLSPTILLIFEFTCDPNFFMQSVSESGYYLVALIVATLLSGVGLGLALKNNGSTGGMDVIQKILSNKLHIPYSLVMYGTDGIIVAFAAFTFIPAFNFNIELVIYGIASVIGTSYLIDTIILGTRSRRTAYIISDFPEEIKNMIYLKINRGVTFISTEGGLTGKERKMVVCTMNKAEAYRLSDYIKEIDPNAFTFITSCKAVIGEYDKNSLWK